LSAGASGARELRAPVGKTHFSLWLVVVLRSTVRRMHYGTARPLDEREVIAVQDHERGPVRGELSPAGTTEVLPVTTDPELDGDHERMSHIVLEGFRPESGDFVRTGPSVAEGIIEATPVRALCGKVWVPNRDPRRYPLCPTCREIAESKGWRVPA
jgi:hypothetical protein